MNQSQSPFDALRARLNGDLAKALTLQQQLTVDLDMTTATEQLLAGQVTQEEATIADLENQVTQLNTQIADLQGRIDVERTQVAALARAMYRKPASFLDIVAHSGSISEALIAAANMVVAGQRAHALQSKLEADLAQVQLDLTARQADLDRQGAAMVQLNANMDSLSTVMAEQQDLASQLTDLIARIRAAEAGVQNQPIDVTQALAKLLEQEEQNLIQQEEQAAWTEATLQAGLALVLNELPTGVPLDGIHFSSPLPGGRMTQPFGPTNFALEPPLGPYRHFHTGVDISAPIGTPVLSAADGLVVAVGHTKVGYGNYVIIAHGGEILTLYAHLLETDVTVGTKVIRTERIGLEGMSGLATGPHVHFEVRINGQFVNPLTYLPA